MDVLQLLNPFQSRCFHVSKDQNPETLMSLVHLNNKRLSLVTHAGYEGGDTAGKNT